MIITTLQFSANLDEGVQETTLNQPLFTGDQEAHRFEILCFRNRRRESVSLTGADVQGYFVRSNQVTYPIKGEIINNSAVVQLPAACYSATGPFSLVIKLALDGVIHTIFCGHGKMKAAHTDTIIDPGEVIPSLDELLAQIDAMEKATADALAVASMTAEAQTLPAGSLATAAYKDGKLTLGIPKGLDSETALPTGYKPNQMLVIGPDGKPCWEERTHYDYSGGGTVLPETTLNLLGGYTTFKEPFDPMPVVGVPYKVTYYGIEYTCTAQALEEDGRACVTIGNQSEIGAGINTQEPFIFMFYPAETATDGIYGYFSCTATDKSTMAVSIVGAGEIKKLDPKFLPEGAGGGGLPTGGEPYKQLVTDGVGNAVWEDRLAYEDISAVIIPETTLTPLEEAGNMGVIFDAPLNPPVSGETYLITYNGTPYQCTAYGVDDDGDGVEEMVYIGNFALMGADVDTGEPFMGMLVTDLAMGAEMGYYGGFMHIGGLETFTLSMAQAIVKKIAPNLVDLSDYYTKTKTDELLSACLPKAEYEAERAKGYEEITAIDMNGVADTGQIALNGVYEKIWLNIAVDSPQESVNLKVSLFNGDGTPAMVGTLWNMLPASSTERRIDAFMYVDGGLAGVTEASVRSDSQYLTTLQRYICGLGGAYTYKGFGGLQVATLSGNPVSATSAKIYVHGIKV